MSKRSKQEGALRVHQEIIAGDGSGRFTVVKTLLTPAGLVAAELTAVDKDKGVNVSIGIDPATLSHLIWQHRALRAAWRRRRDREKSAARKLEAGEE